MVLHDKLTLLGLNPKQAKIYLAALELGGGSITNIAKQAGVNRTTAYTMIDDLIGMGLMSFSIKKKTRYYVPAEPEELQNLITTKETLLKQLMPQLVSLSNVTQKKPKILFFQGLQGMIALQRKHLLAKKEVCYFGDAEFYHHEVLEKHIPDIRKQRIMKGIQLRLIMHDSPFGREGVRDDKIHLRRTKLIAKEQFPFKTSFYLFDNKVIITSPSEMMGLYIESQDISETLQSLFNLAWDNMPYIAIPA